MLRATALSLIVLFSVAVIIPVMDSSAHSGQTVKGRHYKRHSRAWWRRYHARRRRRIAIARQRAREAQRAIAAANAADSSVLSHHVGPLGGGVLMDPRGMWSATLPAGWSNRSTPANGEVKFRIFTPDGRAAGYSDLSPVNVPATPKGLLSAKAQKRFLGDVSFSDLRRVVIEKMLNSNGWVTNDFEQQIDGKRVFVVVAQTAGSQGSSVGTQPWAFYFTEINGHIYSLATTAPSEFYDQATAGSEKLLASFKTTARPSVVATASR